MTTRIFQFGYVNANDTKLSSSPDIVMVREEYSHVLFSSEGKSSPGIGLISTMRRIVEQCKLNEL